MVITKLNGGLGNQMFQYAVARRIACLNNDLVKLDISSFGDYTIPNYCLNQLNIVENIATEEEIANIKNIRFIKEDYFHFNPAILNLSGDVYLEGYWQSERYFKDIKDIICQEFTVKGLLNTSNCELANTIQNCMAVAVHFRRGDYVTVPENNQYNGICHLDYYREAMTAIAENEPQAHFFIFSDDLPWVRQNVKFDFPCTFVANNDVFNGFEDLRLMSLCKHFIIANSTFSWWGAWLSPNSDKVVFAPRKWFNIPTINTKDLIPDSWNVI